MYVKWNRDDASFTPPSDEIEGTVRVGEIRQWTGRAVYGREYLWLSRTFFSKENDGWWVGSPNSEKVALKGVFPVVIAILAEKTMAAAAFGWPYAHVVVLVEDGLYIMPAISFLRMTMPYIRP